MKAENKIKFVKAIHPSQPEWEYYLPKEDKALIKKLSKKPIFPKLCDRPCTSIITLFPKDTVGGHTGKGYYMINIDGYRMINAYVISDPLNSTNQRGFTLELSFVLIIAMLQSLILLNGGWISQMNARIPGIHYTVYQPVPIVRGLYHQALELTSKRFQGLQNEIEVIGDTLLEYAFELLVQNPNVGVA